MEKVPIADFRSFLENAPSMRLYDIQDSFLHQISVVYPILHLHCETDVCSGNRIFEPIQKNSPLFNVNNPEINLFVEYKCRNCGKIGKTYSLLLSYNRENQAKFYALKYGEIPELFPVLSSRFIKLLGEDAQCFFKGLKRELNGLGIGAFTYYRRVIENQKSRIVDQFIKVANRIESDQTVIDLLNKAKNESQFSKSIEIIKDAIPEVLKINGNNPLKLLHSALSKGLHSQSDEECLEIANSIRIVLNETAERISIALKNQNELDEAINRITLPNRKLKTGK